MSDYRPRVADRMLALKLEAMGAVLIEGAKYCGKTTMAAQQAGSVLYMADPETREQNLMMVSTNIRRLLMGETPRLIDEWQLAPKFWDAVRGEVDMRGEDGQFILTGSAVPPDDADIYHSGAGRIGWLRLRTMSLWESGDSSGEVSLGALFDSADVPDGESRITLDRLAYLVCRGGWPKGVVRKSESAALMQVADYYEAVTRSDISRVDGVKRDPELARRLMRSYARLQGSQAGVGTILADVRANEDEKLGENTIYSYIKALKRIFVIEDSMAWNPNLRSKTSIRTSDTRYFSDPSIATTALGLGPKDLINDLNTFGLLFETLCVRDLRVYADALGGTVYHYRDKNGLECDAVVHLRNGRYGLVEVKLGGDDLINEGAASLLKLAATIDTDRMFAPSFMMVVTGVGQFAYKRQDGVLVVPIGTLKE
ncbi:MAG: ATP-binding protein [Bacteroidaceae bacterium]|nr:ATP-binding protein [Bacteroidaceae bacterium]